MTTPVIYIKKLNPEKDNDISFPEYMTSGSAGMDICAAIDKDYIISSGDITLIPTGFSMALPENFEAQIRPRSGLAVKHGITIINAPGTIDSDYRGEIKVALINHGKLDYTVKRGDRIAQMIISKVFQGEIKVVNSLDETSRSSGGFGHTGK